MRASALMVIALLALTGTSHGFLKETVDNFKNWFVDLGSQLVNVGSALLDSTLSQAKSLLSQSVQALGGAVISALPPSLAGKIIGKRSDILSTLNLDDLSARGEALKQIVKSTLADLEKLTEELYDDLPNMSLAEYNAAVDEVTDRHEFAVRSVIGDAVGLVTDALKAALSKLKGTVADLTSKILGDEEVSKREVGLVNDVETVARAAELLFKRAEDTIVQMAKEVGDAMKVHAADLLTAIREKTADIKEEIESIEGRMEVKGVDIAAHARVLLEQLKAHADSLIRSTVSKLQEAGHKIAA